MIANVVSFVVRIIQERLLEGESASQEEGSISLEIKVATCVCSLLSSIGVYPTGQKVDWLLVLMCGSWIAIMW